MFRVYMGYDAREPLAYDVCEYSIKRRTRNNVEVNALNHRELRRQGDFRRPWLTLSDGSGWMDLIDNKPFSTEFSHTRFLVPYLAGYDGWALFMDCDMIFQCDIRELFALADDKYAAMVVKHAHNPDTNTKMDGQPQSPYYRKNWSSFVLWNCGHHKNKILTPEYVSYETGRNLHTFAWLDDSDIGHLGYEWNWIEGSSPAMESPNVIHYTLGGPWFDEDKYPECHDVLYADRWWIEKEHMERYGE